MRRNRRVITTTLQYSAPLNGLARYEWAHKVSSDGFWAWYNHFQPAERGHGRVLRPLRLAQPR